MSFIFSTRPPDFKNYSIDIITLFLQTLDYYPEIFKVLQIDSGKWCVNSRENNPARMKMFLTINGVVELVLIFQTFKS